MRYVKKDNEIFAYDSNQNDLYEQAISEGAEAISDVEANEIANPPLSEEQQIERNKQLRLMAYKAESDPLFIEWQYDKTDDKELVWRSKVEEIKSRFPI